MFGDTLVGVQVTGNALTLTDVRGGTAGRNLPNAVTGGALTLTGQQLSLQASRHTGGDISLGSVTLPAGGGGGGVDQTARDAAAAAQTDADAAQTDADAAQTTADAAATEVAFTAHAANASAHHVKTPAGGGGGDDAYPWATEGNTDEMPRDKLWNDTLIGVTTGGGQIVFENAGGLYLPFPFGGGGGVDQTARDAAEAAQTDADANAAAITALPSPRQLSNTTPVQSSTSGNSGTSALVSRGDHRHQGDGGGGGGGDDAYSWATEGDTGRIPIAKMSGNLLHTVTVVNYNQLRLTEVDGTQHDVTINLPAAGSVTEAMLAMHNVPTNAQVIGWDQSNDRMVWVNAATDQRIVDLINDHNPTAVPGAVTQTGGGDRGSGPKFSWEDHTHQIVGIQLDDIPGTPITTVPDDARLLIETASGINRKITGANARTSLGGGGGGVDFATIPELTTLDLADRLLIGDNSDSLDLKYLDAETLATIIRPEVFHGTTRIGSGPSALNFDSSHFTVTGDNDGAEIQLANVGGGNPTVTLIDGDFTLGVRANHARRRRGH